MSSKNIKTELGIKGYLCNNCKLVILKELEHKYPYLSFVITLSTTKNSIRCERCGYEDREHPDYEKIEIKNGFELSCIKCRCLDIYYPTFTGLSNCTMCESLLNVRTFEELESKNSPSSQTTIFDL